MFLQTIPNFFLILFPSDYAVQSKQDRYIRRQLVLVPNDYSSYEHHWNTG